MAGLTGAHGDGYNSLMKKANISQVKNHLSQYLDYVRTGGRVKIFDRDVPVAELAAPAAAAGRGRPADDSRLALLERRGLVRRHRGSLRPLWTTSPSGRGGGVLRALLDEREKS